MADQPPPNRDSAPSRRPTSVPRMAASRGPSSPLDSVTSRRESPGLTMPGTSPGSPSPPPPDESITSKIHNPAATLPLAPPSSAVREPGPSSRPRSAAPSSRQPQADLAAPVGKFDVEFELGRGGMAVVFLARDRELRRELAIKRMKTPATRHAEDRFVEEAQITGQLEHPNIVPIHEFGRDADGSPWIAMKRVRGRTAYDLIEDWAAAPSRALTPQQLAQILDIFRKVCDAISFAHQCGVMHRDLKPQNIMVGEFGEVLVMDWGLAKPLSEPIAAARVHPQRPRERVTSDRRAQVSASDLTADGVSVGTPAYMAPEQAFVRENGMDARVDVFGLGAVLYHLLTLERPYIADTVLLTLLSAANGDLMPPRKRAPERGIPPELEAIVMRAMAHSPEHRYPRVVDLLADLTAFQTMMPISAFRDTLVGRARKWVMRHPTGTLGMVSAAMLVLVAGIFMALLQAAAVREADARAKAADTLAENEKLAREKLAAERDHREAQIREWVQQGEIAKLRSDLGIKLVAERDEVRGEFMAIWAKSQAVGEFEDALFRRLGRERVREFIAAFDALLRANEEYGDEIPVTAKDYFFLGLLHHLGLNDQPAGLEFYNRGLLLDPDDLDSLTNRGLLLLNLGRYDEAIADFDAVLAARPTDYESLLGRGSVLLDLERHDAAIADFSAAIAADPSRGFAFYNRGRVHFMRLEFETAIADFSHAIKANPNDASAYCMRGDSYRELGQLGPAMQDFNRALELDPMHTAALLGRGQIRMVRGETDAATHDFARAVEFTPDRADTFFERGRTFVALNDFDKAAADFQRAVDLDPNHAKAWTHLGICLSKLGRHDDALAALGNAIALTPDYFLPYFTRGEVFSALGRIPDAIAEYSKTIDRNPTHIGALNNRGARYQTIGELSLALADFERILELHPADWLALFNRGIVLAQMGHTAAARESFTQARQLAPPERHDAMDEVIRNLLGD